MGALPTPGHPTGEIFDERWIRSYAVAPRRLSDGQWVWLSHYEWRWQRPKGGGPAALNPPRVVSRRAAAPLPT